MQLRSSVVFCPRVLLCMSFSYPTPYRPHSYVTNCPDIRKRVNSFRKEELPPDEEQEQEEDKEHDHPDAAWEAVLQQVAELCDEGDATWSPPGSWSAQASPTAPRPPLPMLMPQLSAPPFGAFTLPPWACVPNSAGLEEGEAILEAKGAEGVSALFNPGTRCQIARFAERGGGPPGATGSGGSSRR